MVRHLDIAGAVGKCGTKVDTVENHWNILTCIFNVRVDLDTVHYMWYFEGISCS